MNNPHFRVLEKVTTKCDSCNSEQEHQIEIDGVIEKIEFNAIGIVKDVDVLLDIKESNV